MYKWKIIKIYKIITQVIRKTLTKTDRIHCAPWIKNHSNSNSDSSFNFSNILSLRNLKSKQDNDKARYLGKERKCVFYEQEIWVIL